MDGAAAATHTFIQKEALVVNAKNSDAHTFAAAHLALSDQMTLRVTSQFCTNLRFGGVGGGG